MSPWENVLLPRKRLTEIIPNSARDFQWGPSCRAQGLQALVGQLPCKRPVQLAGSCILLDKLTDDRQIRLGANPKLFAGAEAAPLSSLATT